MPLITSSPNFEIPKIFYEPFSGYTTTAGIFDATYIIYVEDTTNPVWTVDFPSSTELRIGVTSVDYGQFQIVNKKMKFSDGYVSTQAIVTAQRDYVGVCGRYKDINNYCAAYIRTDASTSNRNLYVRELINGTGVWASVNVPNIANDVYYWIDMVMTGTDVTAYLYSSDRRTELAKVSLTVTLVTPGQAGCWGFIQQNGDDRWTDLSIVKDNLGWIDDFSRYNTVPLDSVYSYINVRGNTTGWNTGVTNNEFVFTSTDTILKEIATLYNGTISSDGTIRSKIKIDINGNYIGIIARYVDVNNWVSIRCYTSTSSTSRFMFLEEMKNGTRTNVNVLISSLVINTYYQIELILNGANATANIYDETGTNLIATVSRSDLTHLTAGRAGCLVTANALNSTIGVIGVNDDLEIIPA